MENFLRGLLLSFPSQRPIPDHRPSPTIESPSQQPQLQPTKTKIVGYILGEERVESRAAIDVLAKLLTRFARDDPRFLERFSQDHETVGPKRRVVTKDPAELYGEPHLLVRHKPKRLMYEYLLGTNQSKKDIQRNIKIACRVAGVKFGTELRLIGF